MANKPSDIKHYSEPSDIVPIDRGVPWQGVSGSISLSAQLSRHASFTVAGNSPSLLSLLCSLLCVCVSVHVFVCVSECICMCMWFNPCTTSIHEKIQRCVRCIDVIFQSTSGRNTNDSNGDQI